MSKRMYAVGDIHGDLEKLKAIHARIEKDRQGDMDAPVIHIGDLVDRREDSRGVINFLMQGQQAGQPWVVLKGNHDRLFYWFLEDPLRKDPNLRPDYTWLHPRIGGMETLASYGIDVVTERPLEELHAEAVATVPAEHHAYLSNLLTSYVCNGILFAHAGIRPGVALADQTEDDLIWIRKGWLEVTEPHEMLVIHGHTHIPEVTDYGNRINIDTGAAWGDKMSVIVIEGDHVWVLEEDGRHQLR